MSATTADETAATQESWSPAIVGNLVLASYAAPAAPLSLVGLPMAVYLPPLYSDSDGFGLTLGLVAIIITLSRFTDVITDPIIGFISDRMRTRWGRRKPFVLIGTPIYIVGIWFLFVPPIEFTETTWMGMTFNVAYPYLFVMVALVYLGSTIKDLPYSAWGAELTSNYSERTLVTSWREGFSVTGSMISAFTPAVILFFGYTKPSDAVFVLSIIMTVMMVPLVANLLVVVPEWRVVETRQRRIPLKESLKYVMQNGPYMRLVIIFGFSSLGAAMTNSLSFYFVKHVLLAGDLYGLYLAPYFVSQIAAIPLWFMLSRRIGKHKATMWAIGWYSIWSCLIPLIAIAPYAWFAGFEIPRLLAWLPAETHASLVTYFEGTDTGKFLFFIIVMCFKGSSIGALSALPLAMAADVVDIDTQQTGQQRAGAYFSIWSMVRKLTYALGITIGGGAAVLVGFDSLADPHSGANSEFALIGLACLYSVIPAVFKFVGMPLLWTYPLTEDKVQEIQEDIARQRAEADGQPAAAT